MLRFPTQFTALFVLLSSASLRAVATRHYDIVNNCPSSIDLFINGESQGALAAGATTTRDFVSAWSGFIYTTSNSDRSDGSHTTRAGFFGEVRPEAFEFFSNSSSVPSQENYYYIVIDLDIFNTAVSITPINKAPVRLYFALCSTPRFPPQFLALTCRLSHH